MSLSVAILGSGNTAYHLLRAFNSSDVHLAGLISRDLAKGRETLEASGANCGLIGGSIQTELEADVVILAVPESALTKVVRFYTFRKDQVVVHTSGAESMSTLSFQNSGVFYPLQTMTWGEPMDFSNVPILIEGSNDQVESKLIDLAEAITSQVRMASSEERQYYHAAAVISANFSNHLIGKAESFLATKSLNMDLLFPLIEETVRKAKTIGAKKAQTGPALRGDEATMNRHLDLISDESTKELYRLISEDIRRFHGN
ncbi:MAG: DUF2520 domain-containing protein [Cyclobacteriaceae bacterium]